MSEKTAKLDKPDRKCQYYNWGDNPSYPYSGPRELGARCEKKNYFFKYDVLSNLVPNCAKCEVKKATPFENEVIGKSFKVEWCDLCEAIFVRCPRCGNNSCNGGSGEDGKCPVCPLTYKITNAVNTYLRNIEK